MGILDFVNSADFRAAAPHALMALGKTLTAIDQNRPADFSPIMQAGVQHQQGKQIRGILDAAGIGISPQQRGILGAYAEANPSGALDVLAEHAFQQPQGFWDQHKVVGDQVVGPDPRTGAVRPVYSAPSTPQTRQPPAGYRFADGGALEYIPGGPADPEVKAALRPPNAGLPDGYMPAPGGGVQPIPGSANDPAAISEAEAARIEGRNLAERRFSAPGTIDKADFALATVDRLLAHPGFDAIYGISGLVPNRWGGEAAGAETLRKQLEGQAFLQAFESLKGGGQITQIEGEKATAAYNRAIDPSLSEEEARRAWGEFADFVRMVKSRAEGALAAPDAQATNPTDLQGMSTEDLLRLYNQ